jgi:protein-S-isoprenylcysteine O-methyltransferase Ste14
MNNDIRIKVLLRALSRYLIAIVFISALIFLPAGTLKFTNGWIFIAGLFIPMTILLIYLLIMDPELLEKRINLREKEDAQKKYVKFSILLFIVAYIIPGFDYRFGWSELPMWVSWTALAFMISGYGMFIAVMIQNRYASRVIEIQESQKLIDTGLYSVVRHPMYLAAIILYLSSALVLGSFYALLPMMVLPFLLGFRVINEEKVLVTGLPGYEEYRKKVKYRIIPFIW